MNKNFIYKYFYQRSWMLCLFFMLFCQSIYAKPVFRITADQSKLQLSKTGSAIINFTVRNVSGRALTITNVSNAGYDTQVLSSRLTSNNCLTRLANNGTCTVSSRVSAKGIDASTSFEINTCAFNGAICSGMKVKLSITTGATSQASISIQGSPLTLRVDGGTGNLIITNTSNSVTATNITANLSGTALQGEATIIGNTCAQVAPGSQCIITFRSGSNNVSLTNITISGDNTNEITSQVRIRTLMAYVGRRQIGATRVTYCKVENSGFFSNCNTTAANFDRVSHVALFNDNTMAYVANTGNNSVSRCDVDSTTGNLINCFDANATNISFPGRIRLSNNESVANITSRTTNEVVTCTVNPNTRNFDACTTYNNIPGPAGIYDGPIGLSFNTNLTRAYVTNQFNDEVYVCPFVNDNPDFNNCALAAATPDSPTGIVLNNDSSFAYITFASIITDNVLKCTVNQNDGTLAGCADSGVGAIFTRPYGITLNTDNTLAYVTSRNDDQVFVCTIIQTAGPTLGDFSGCVDSGAGAIFNFPHGITLALVG